MKCLIHNDLKEILKKINIEDLDLVKQFAKKVNESNHILDILPESYKNDDMDDVTTIKLLNNKEDVKLYCYNQNNIIIIIFILIDEGIEILDINTHTLINKEINKNNFNLKIFISQTIEIIKNKFNNIKNKKVY